MIDRKISETFGPLANKNKKSKRYLVLLFIGKVLECIGYFMFYEILKEFNFLQILFFVKLISSLVFIIVHKPISNGKRIDKRDIKKLTIHASFTIILNLLFMEGLIICGPVRTILLSCHSSTTILGIINLIFNQQESSTRGVGYFGFGLFCLFFFDRDIPTKTQDYSELSQHMYHHTVDIFSWLGLPDHKGGIFLLLIMSVSQIIVKNYGAHAASSLNGDERFHALSSCFECVLLVPFFLGSFYFSNQSSFGDFFQYKIILTIFVLFVMKFYIETVCTNNLPKLFTQRVGSICLFIFGLMVGFVWEHYNDTQYQHKASSGVIFATISFVLTTSLMVQPTNIRPRGSLIGYTTSGEPLYSMKHLTTKSFPLRHYIGVIASSPESRSIFFYLCLNLFFTAIELLYGVWTNSLGLVSDGFHMLFDCSALVLGLWAAVAAKWSPTKIFSFGYGRIEVLSGFVNGLFLVVIAFAVFSTALQRIINPPHVHTENLLTVSVLGLLVNLVGIIAFSHAHSHGGKACEHSHNNTQDKHNHSHSHGNKHDHGHDHSHSHSHSHQTKVNNPEKGNANMEGVFLHVLADTMGSVGVIISTLLIKYYELHIADPICSLFIAVLIIGSVIPLLKSSAYILLQKASVEVEKRIPELLLQIKSIPDVVACRQLHVWQHTPDVLYATLIIQINVEASEHYIRQKVISTIKEHKINHLNIQIEKQSFYEHMAKVTTGYYTEIILPERHERTFAMRTKDI